MLIDVEFAMLNHPHFHITGKSLGDRLDTRKQQEELKMVWDTDTKLLAITWHGRTGYVVESNVKAFFPMEEGKLAAKSVSRTQTPHVKAQAQVDSPQSHVFSGPGHGKTK